SLEKLLPHIGKINHPLQHIKSTNTASYKNDKLIAFNSNANNDKSILLSLDTQLKTETGIQRWRQVNRAIPIFERTHPGKIALFMFDNSSNHDSFAEDALLVSNNVNQPKGIRRVLKERNLWISGLIKRCNKCKKNKPDSNNTNCCASRILSTQPDFAVQKSRIQEVKRYARLNCNYTFKSLKKTVPKALDSVSLMKIRRFAHHSARFMSANELGLSGKAAIFAVKKYRSHRRVPEKVLEEFIHD
ncbi:7618_t:CDS:2, partial [Scutellospora calospora]